MNREQILKEIKTRRYRYINDSGGWNCPYCESRGVVIFDAEGDTSLPIIYQGLVVCPRQKTAKCLDHQCNTDELEDDPDTNGCVFDAFRKLIHSHPFDNPNNKEDTMSTQNEMNLKEILMHVGGDAAGSIKEGAIVGTSAEARQIVIDLFWKMIPNDLFPRWVRETNLFKRAEPIVASLTVMFMTTFFSGQIPYAEKIYNVANKALVADGIEIVRPMIAKMREAVNEMVAKGLIVDNDQVNE